MRRAGSASPEAISAARTRSFASLTALSGSPTILNAGSPGATCTWTSTARASMPSNATVVTCWTMPPPTRTGSCTGWRRGRQEQLGNEYHGSSKEPDGCDDCLVGREDLDSKIRAVSPFTLQHQNTLGFLPWPKRTWYLPSADSELVPFNAEEAGLILELSV